MHLIPRSGPWREGVGGRAGPRAIMRCGSDTVRPRLHGGVGDRWARCAPALSSAGLVSLFCFRWPCWADSPSSDPCLLLALSSDTRHAQANRRRRRTLGREARCASWTALSSRHPSCSTARSRRRRRSMPRSSRRSYSGVQVRNGSVRTQKLYHHHLTFRHTLPGSSYHNNYHIAI